MMKKIKVLILTLLIFCVPLMASGYDYEESMKEIEKTVEKINSNVKEETSVVETLHPNVKEDKAFLIARVQNKEDAKVYFQWGRTEDLENKTKKQEIDSSGRVVEEIEGLRGSAGAYYARPVLETSENTFYGETVSFAPSKQKNKREEAPDINAEAAYSLHYEHGSPEVVYRKNGYKKLPVSGLTKLLTGLVSFEEFDLSKEVDISSTRLANDERLDDVELFKETTVEDLLRSLLVNSNNGAAYALSIGNPDVTHDQFVSMMNERASEIGMKDSEFFNPIGLDEFKGINKSTARDIGFLMNEVMAEDDLAEMMQKESLTLESTISDVSYSEVNNDNKFINGGYFFTDGEPDWLERIIGGHGGWTSESGACLVTVVEDKDGRGYYINVLLGAEDDNTSYMEMDKLIDWLMLDSDEDKKEEDKKDQPNYSESEEDVKESSISDIPEDFAFEERLSRGMEGKPVKYLQIFLNHSGAEVAKPGNAGSSGMETEYFGPATKQAVEKFQEDHFDEILKPVGEVKGLGVVDERTRKEINTILNGDEKEEVERFDYEEWMEDFEKLKK